MKKIMFVLALVAIFGYFSYKTVLAQPSPPDPAEIEISKSPCGGPCYDPHPKLVENEDGADATSGLFDIYMADMGGMPPPYNWPSVLDGYSMFYPGTVVFSNRDLIHACLVGRDGVFQYHDPLSNPPSGWAVEIKYSGTDMQGHFFWTADFTPWSCVNNPYGHPLTRPWCNGDYTSVPGESYIGIPTCTAVIKFSGQNGAKWIPPYKTWFSTISGGQPQIEATPYP